MKNSKRKKTGKRKGRTRKGKKGPSQRSSSKTGPKGNVEAAGQADHEGRKRKMKRKRKL